ncbi:Cystatin domain [Dillenia turbinata]|uniref:Cystatin domain n=1 Tax=Dillenia turbinata TaxID=194707 RepID=A0AAN8URF2_9MAGN
MVRFQVLVSILVPLVLLLGISATTEGPWITIHDLNDPRVIDIAKFAVSELNKKISPGGLEFKSVDQGWSQLGRIGGFISHTNFKLDITTLRQDASVHKYEVIVLELTDARNFMSLSSYKELHV